ncbi:MAG: N-acetyl-gamma-glutamyl-phosphate reductase [Bryobacterales bacterium]
MSARIRAGVVGFTGYSGAEAVRILRHHPSAEPLLLEHRAQSDSEKPVFDDGVERFAFTREGLAESKADVVLLATAHEVSLEAVPMCLEAGVRVIDLSGSFRLRTPDQIKRWYGLDHPDPQLLADAVYGLPEFYRDKVRGARFVSNPGCYPTAANLAIRPLVAAGVINREAGVVCDAKSGVSGAGKQPTAKTHFCQVTENFSAYNVMFHRHVPEILQNSDLEESELFFTAQLLPLHRGILETIYVRTLEKMSHADVAEVYRKAYADEPFVRIYPEGRLPDLRAVQETNFCDIGFKVDPETRRLTVVAAEDNLGKGAAGQAIQNMNLMLGLPETDGLL